MEITFIGCGDSFSEELGNNSALLEFGNENLMIDIPDSNFSRIKKIKKDYSDIQNIFVTHLHADHINGLERFAYYRKYATPLLRPNENIDKPNLFIHESLYFGLWDSVKHGLGITTEGIKSLEDYFNVQLVKDKFKIGNVSFKLCPVEHVPNMNVFGLFVEKEFYYSTDSTYNYSKIDHYLKNTKKIFHDIHFFDKNIPPHASIYDFSRLKKEEQGKIFAMHYDDNQKNRKNYKWIRLVKPFEKIKI